MASGFEALIAARALLEGGEPGRRPPKAASSTWRRRRPGTAPGAVFLAEHYLPGVSADTLEALTRRLRAAAAELRRAGAEVSILGSAGVPDDEALLHFLAAPSPEAVARVCDCAGVAADRIVPVLWRKGRAG